ncbi:hypothetical protein JOM56_008278 [Amanita muscaria]
MSAWPLARASVAPVAFNSGRNTSCRLFTSGASRTTPNALSGLSSPEDVTDTLLDQKLKDLKHFLSIDGHPSRIWSQYTGLLNHLRHQNLPPEIHQQVLRKCTPPSTVLRPASGRRLLSRNKFASPHVYEGRFQAVIRAIRAMGTKPELEDYHFILDQFAAVGHHVGAIQVYKELLLLGLEPKPKTFTLCFQAIAHRITLPILEVNRSKLVAQTKKMTAELLNDMQKYRLPFTSVNLDLCMRILKETLDYEGFECLMKWGYGIDLSNPDRVPLEYLGIGHRKTTADIPDIGLPILPEPLPFSTAALNTTIDMLGRFGDVSGLVQAFEVLTQPLPQASQHFSSFDDDDFGVPVTPLPVSLPYAEPNTTTFSVLIRHLCQKGHATLARHYILQLIDLDKKSKHSLRVALRSKARDKATAPRVAANRGSFIAVFHESNCDKNVGLMRWLNTKIPKIVRKKQTELKFFVRLRKRWIPRHQHDILNAKSSPSIPESSLEHVPSPPLASSSSTPMNERKPFDINLHIQILERDWRELEELRHRVDDVLGRTLQRVKERLGRRVWGEKDLYLHSEGGRVNITRDKWADIANFCPRRGYVDEHNSLNTTPSTKLRSYRQPRTIPRHDSTPDVARIGCPSRRIAPRALLNQQARGRSI